MDEESDVRVWALLDDFFGALAKQLGIKRLPETTCAARGAEWEQTHPGCKFRTPKRGPKAPL